MKKDGLLRNVSVLVTGTVIAQLIPILLQPILKRLFEPEVFGVLDLYLKVLGILFVVFALKYDLGIVLPKNRVKALLLLSLSVTSSVVFSLITLLIVILFGDWIMAQLGIGLEYKIILWFLPFSTLFFTLFNAFNYLLIRDKKFKEVSINKVNRRGVEGGIQVGSAYIPGLNSLGLFLGDLIGNFVYFLSAYYQSFKGFKLDFRFFRPYLLKAIAKEYKDLPKYNIIPELLNTAFFAVISFLVLDKFGIKEVGYMELTQRMLAVPSAFVAYSVGQVLLQKLTENVNLKKKLTHEIRRVFLLMFAMGVPFILVILLWGEPLFGFVFGDEWAVSGVYSRYLVVFYALGFMVSPLGQVLISLQKFGLNAIWKIGRFVLVMPLFFFSYDSITHYLLLYAILGAVSYLVYFIIIIYQSRKFDKTLG